MASASASATPDPRPTNNAADPAADGDESWRFAPPYLALDAPSTPPFTPRWRARCPCGQVRYWLGRAAPLASKCCHCGTCRGLHGAPCQWAAVFAKADVRFARAGAAGLAFYHAPAALPAHRLPCKVSCARCRAPVLDEGRRMALVFPGLVDFGPGDPERARSVFEPRCHIFYSQRVIDIPDGKPKWAGLDGESELMDERERLGAVEGTRQSSIKTEED
ncbi:Mss4-like protein [Durotheca rogersii]|uniref:Mss4-like protein n=1 Tax=Durotheca rogersii TaxID=419775 RepID=UPI00221EF53B|nr:Mss4-like protein [Durotheca rogersii]KAI5865662.1 Mss4-like protein [Durotheca rogersii]